MSIVIISRRSVVVLVQFRKVDEAAFQNFDWRRHLPGWAGIVFWRVRRMDTAGGSDNAPPTSRRRIQDLSFGIQGLVCTRSDRARGSRSECRHRNGVSFADRYSRAG